MDISFSFEPVINLTEDAQLQVKNLLQDETYSDYKYLRVFVQGGGCSGFQYGFVFEKEKNDDDYELIKNDVGLLVDPMSYQYLENSTIDYVQSLYGSQFKIDNPNSTTTCGCGSSFSV